jgi:hypothetical protein
VTGRDRADELRGSRDLWPEIEQHLGAALHDAMDVTETAWLWMGTDVLEAKFRKGEAEHGRDWLGMSRADLKREIEAEVLDLVLYHAMQRARWAETSFISDRDTGDEAVE